MTTSNIRYLLRVFVETQTSFKVCGEAVNGADAIEKAQELGPELILLDLSMPLMTGIEAAPVSKTEGMVGLASHLNSLLVPPLPRPELAGDSLGAGSDIRAATEKPTSETFEADA